MLSLPPLRALALLVVTLSLGGLPLLVHAGSSDPGVRILFVGNSYTGASAPNHLGASYRALLLEAESSEPSVQQDTLAPGGYTLAQHWVDAQGSSQLADILANPQLEVPLSQVVLQDQSQIPGFPQQQPEWQASRDGAIGLAGLATARGADVYLLATWGRRSGDAQNTWRFPDFSTMNELLLTGYEDYAEAIEASGSNATIIPAGLAWAKVHDDITNRGEDPLDSESLFSRLYTPDGSHPTPLGTYLTACTALATIHGASCTTLSWAHPGIDGKVRLRLAEAADWAVATYHDQVGDDDDSAIGDDDDDSAIGDDDDSAIGDDDDSSTADDSDEFLQDSGGDCACSAGNASEPSSALASLLFGALLFARQRRHRHGIFRGSVETC